MGMVDHPIMPSRLPLADAHEKEHTYCTFCPKLCRHACPVTTVDARETTTPWGKMAALHHVAEGNLAHGPEVAATWWDCTGCMRCKSFCDHDNNVAHALGAGRAEALAAGTAPRAAVELREEHRAREARAGARAAEIFGERKKVGARVAYAPGCTGCMVAPEDAKAGLVVVERLMRGDARVTTGICCGLPLLDAGDRAGFLSAARAFVEAAGSAERIVFSDPGCLHALAVIAPALAGEALGGPSLIHLSELAAENLDALAPIDVDEDDVRYHDPCRLGRGLGVYDPPRAVLTKILGKPPLELHHNREHAECSGAGGQLPRTAPETAEGIGKERAADHALAGGGAIVSPCPASRRAFDKAGIRTLGFAELVARSLASDEES